MQGFAHENQPISKIRRSAIREKDEIALQRRILEIARQENMEFAHVDPQNRPIELVQLIEEEADFFSHYNGQVLNENIGNTMSFDYLNDVNVSIRHYYPYDPQAEVSINELGGSTQEQRLVPVSLMSKDLDIDSVIIGRFVAGITKHSARRDDANDFSLQILVMSVCGNGTFRENITFKGHSIKPIHAESSINSQDFRLVATIFESLREGYGKSGIEFFTMEIIRNRYYLSEIAGRDIGLNMAFDAYLKLFGSYMSDFLQEYREQVLATARRIGMEKK